VFDYNVFGEHHVLRSDRPAPVGASTLGVRFRREGRGAEVTLLLDGEEAGHLSLPYAMTIMSSIGPSVGFDAGSPVSQEYAGSFPFEGILHRLDVQLVSPEAPGGDDAAAREGMSRQ